MEYETWSKGEKAIARRAFEQTYERECTALAGEVRRRAISIKEPSDMWALHDLLTRDERQLTKSTTIVIQF
jgi:photoprotection regulator FRP-like protein